jgi:hypothetical protein
MTTLASPESEKQRQGGRVRVRLGTPRQAPRPTFWDVSESTQRSNVIACGRERASPSVIRGHIRQHGLKRKHAGARLNVQPLSSALLHTCDTPKNICLERWVRHRAF